jgi:glutamine cyclotransferase
MKTIPLFAVLYLLTLSACNDSEKVFLKGVIDINAAVANKVLLTDTLNFHAMVQADAVDSFFIAINDVVVLKNELPKISIVNYCRKGLNNITVLAYKNGRAAKREKKFRVYIMNAPIEPGYTLLDSLPYDEDCFTQGLVHHHDTLIYSCGQSGQSRIGMLTTKGKETVVYSFGGNPVFAEGIARVNDHYLLLSWQDNKIFVFNQSFESVHTLAFPPQIKEGWGITNKHDTIFISDGTSSIKRYVFSTDFNLRYLNQIHVSDYQTILPRINELATYKGFIIANSWGRNHLYFIDAVSGEIVQQLNLNAVAKKHAYKGVLNGIAVAGDDLFVTGKNWGKVFRIRLRAN